MRSYKTSQAKRTSYIYYSATGEKITITPDEGIAETHIELLHSLDDAEVNEQRRHYHMVPVHLDTTQMIQIITHTSRMITLIQRSCSSNTKVN